MPIIYPLPLEHRPPARVWSFFDTAQGRVVARDRPWPNSAGTPVPFDPPTIVPLLQTAPPTQVYDSRLRVAVQPPTDVVDVETGTIYQSYATPLRPADELVAAVLDEAERRKSAAIEAAGIRSPTDVLVAIGLLRAMQQGSTPSAAQAALLAGIQATALDTLSAIDTTAAEIVAWIGEHPGEEPNIGDAVWPAAAP